MPIANSGPQVTLYTEMLRRKGMGIAGTNEQEEGRAGLGWWLLTLFYSYRGT